MADSILTSEDFPKMVLTHLYGLYNQGVLCDVTLLTATAIEFPAHKAVLVSSSGYFRKLMNEGGFLQDNQIKINIHPACLKILLDFMYSGSLHLNCSNVWLVQDAAVQLQIETAVSLCCNFSQKLDKKPHVSRPLHCTDEKEEPGLLLKDECEPAYSVSDMDLKIHHPDIDEQDATLGIKTESDISVAGDKEIKSEIQDIGEDNDDDYVNSPLDDSDSDPDYKANISSSKQKKHITKRTRKTSHIKKRNSKANKLLSRNVKLQRKQACQICKKTFVYRSQLFRHQKILHKVDKYYKARYLVARSLLQLQIETSRDASSAKTCLKCRTEYKSFTQFFKHTRLLHLVKWPCAVCNTVFETFTQLHCHRQRCNTQDNVRSIKYSCKKCNRVFLYRKTRDRHIKMAHKKILSCAKCNKTFPSKARVLSHIHKVHQEGTRLTEPTKQKSGRKIMCKICGKEYKTHKSLTNHLIRAHVAEQNSSNSGDHKGTTQVPQDNSGEEEFAKDKDKYDCSLCNISIKDYTSLRGHLKQVHYMTVAQYKKKNMLCKKTENKTEQADERKNNKMKEVTGCELCGQQYKSKNHLKVHVKNAHTLTMAQYNKTMKNNLSCEVSGCNVISKSYQQLKTHTKQSHPETEHACNLCYYKSCLKQDVVKHHKRVHEKAPLHTCDLCQRAFRKGYDLRLHRLLRHNIQDPTLKTHKCEVEGCSYVAACASVLKVHAAKHIKDKPFQCRYCSRNLKTRVTLEKHINKKHLNIRPFLCQVCGSSYGEENELKAHMARHSQTKPYACDHCPYSTVCKTDLAGHMFSRHRIRMDDTVKIYECTKCDYSTIRPSQFERHQKHHLNIRDHVCNICGKTFVQERTLNKHIHWVHNEKKLHCHYCEHVTADIYHLKEHIRVMHTHRDLKPYKCAYCDYRCKISGNARKHCMYRHKGLEVKYIKLEDTNVVKDVTSQSARARLDSINPFPDPPVLHQPPLDPTQPWNLQSSFYNTVTADTDSNLHLSGQPTSLSLIHY